MASGDVLVVAHKVVSKAEGRLRRLPEVEPGERARELAAAHGKDPRAVQVVLDEAAAVLRAERGVLICETRHGFVCANAGVDASNAADPD
ncbi:MAG: coenzyme F420-0:L-glutamate ligase / coenzyme F420:gamma-L-glutamate ligase, partial [Thermoleophilaceae bacterium]|nr:coenzyme F420-0:L-glutamate ligase / coenzyme F420:gamma-L-glutamate ligase [Thermoleophilaceae bacterium]